MEQLEPAVGPYRTLWILKFGVRVMFEVVRATRHTAVTYCAKSTSDMGSFLRCGIVDSRVGERAIRLIITRASVPAPTSVVCLHPLESFTVKS